MTPEELKMVLKSHNPVSRLKSLADSKVPIFHIHGDVDTVVPLDRNSGAVAIEYAKLGGQMILEVPKGQGHNMWRGFFESQTLVDFILKELKSSQP
jgi:predicted esterase